MNRICLIFLVLCSLECVTRAQVEWSWRTPPNVQGLTYADGQFVAVGSYDRIFSSKNGQTWTARTPVVSAIRDLFDVTYQPGRWVAVGRGGRVLASADGRVWTEYTTPVTADFYRVGSANGIYVAGTSAGDVLSSTDGMNWIVRYAHISSDAPIAGVAYGNGRYVVIPQYNNTVHYSTDGVSWTNVTASGLSLTAKGMAFGNGLFVAVGDAGKIRTSTDGVAWTTRTSPITGDIRQIVFREGQFAAAAANGVVLTSPDGITWTQRSTGASTVLANIEHGNGTWVVFNLADPIAPMVSRDLTSWTTTTAPAINARGCTYANGLYVAVGLSGAIFTSTDGFAWTQRTSGITRDLVAVTYGGGVFVATGGYGEILSSPDGITWTRRTTSLTGAALTIGGVAYGNGRFVAFYTVTPGTTAGIVTSLNGTTWTVGGSFAASWYLSAIASNGTSFLAVTSRAEAWTSTTGTSWTKVHNEVSGDTSVALAYGSGQYAIAGYYGKLWTTPNGTTWTPRGSGAPSDYYGMGFANGNFVAVGRFGLLTTSADGVTWTIRSTGWEGSGGTFYGATGGPGLLLAVGDSGSPAASRIRVGYPYSAWKQDYFPNEEFSLAISDIDAIPGGDGLPNKLKYALGLPPRENASLLGLAPTMGTVSDVSGTHGTLTFTRSRDAASFLQYRLMGTSSLSSGTWENTFASPTVISARTNHDIIQCIDPAPAGTKFFRLEIDFVGQLAL